MAQTKNFFKFHLFPNLTMLFFYLDYNYNIPIDKSVKDAFKLLKNINHFEFDVSARPKNTKYLIEGICKMKKVKILKIMMPFIKKSEMLKIKNYIYKCDEIESFRYHVDLSNSSDTFHIQNKNILKLADSLKYKNTLIDLEIDAKGTRLKEISIMLGKITIKSIKHFSLMCMDDVFKKNKDASRADGLINFMSN